MTIPVVEPSVQVPGFKAFLTFTPPDDPLGEVLSATITVASTRQRLARHKRQSVYKHTVTFDTEADPAHHHVEHCVFTSHAHPLSDPFDYLQRLLKHTACRRSHLSHRASS